MTLKSIRHCGVELLHRVAQVLARFLERVELRLLVLRQEPPDLRHRFVDDRLSFLHGILVDRHDLRPRLIEQRFHFRLLIRCEVQRLGQVFHCKPMSMAAVARKAAGTILRVSPREAAQSDCAHSSECK